MCDTCCARLRDATDGLVADRVVSRESIGDAVCTESAEGKSNEATLASVLPGPALSAAVSNVRMLTRLAPESVVRRRASPAKASIELGRLLRDNVAIRGESVGGGGLGWIERFERSVGSSCGRCVMGSRDSSLLAAFTGDPADSVPSWAAPDLFQTCSFELNSHESSSQEGSELRRDRASSGFTIVLFKQRRTGW